MLQHSSEHFSIKTLYTTNILYQSNIIKHALANQTHTIKQPSPIKHSITHYKSKSLSQTRYQSNIHYQTLSINQTPSINQAHPNHVR